MTEFNYLDLNGTGSSGSSSGDVGGGFERVNGSSSSHHHHSTSNNTKLVPVVNQPFQALLLILILVAAIITNGSVILNISRDSLKLRMVHFLLIRHVCITDSVGAIFVLPVPLISFIKGYWIWGDTACSVISTTTACCWTMHLVAVALYRADRVFAVWLPTGRYPIISARVVNGLLVLVWATALTGSYLATYTFTPTFQPALALCIPNVPLIFFILVFASYILGLIILTTGYVFAFISRRRKRKKRKELQQQQQQEQHQAESSSSRTTTTNLTTINLTSTTSRDHDHDHESKSPSSKSAPQLLPHHSTTDCCNNKLLMSTTTTTTTTTTPMKQVIFETNQTNSSSTITPSTSEHSCSNMGVHHHHRALTPPPQPSSTNAKYHQQQTHRRSHSDSVRINQIVISNESVVSVQYRTLCKPCDDSSDEYTGVDESVAEKLDECEDEENTTTNSNNVVVVQSSSDASNNNNNLHYHHHHHHHSHAVKRPRSARCRVFASYAVSIGHLLLYLPAMLVVGLLGGRLPPGVAFLCGTVVYCEFIVQPIALLLVSPKLRNEVILMVRNIFRRNHHDQQQQQQQQTHERSSSSSST